LPKINEAIEEVSSSDSDKDKRRKRNKRTKSKKLAHQLASNELVKKTLGIGRKDD